MNPPTFFFGCFRFERFRPCLQKLSYVVLGFLRVPLMITVFARRTIVTRFRGFFRLAVFAVAGPPENLRLTCLGMMRLRFSAPMTLTTCFATARDT